MTIENVASELQAFKEPIIIIFAFNATGKTRLSVAYKNLTKDEKGNHAGVYFNAYSEDLFSWDNDEENNNAEMRLIVEPSTLSQYHKLVDEEQIRNLLQPYAPRYDFRFRFYDDENAGIEHVMFLDEQKQTPIKISRGEERILCGVFSWRFLR